MSTCRLVSRPISDQMLEQRLRVSLGDLVPELHRRASRWFAENGYKSDAVDHALFAKDYPRAVQLIEEIAEIDWDRARESRLLRWFKKLPDETIETNPKLCIFYARELFKSGCMDDAEKRLQAAEQMLESTSISDPEKEGLRGRISVIRAYISTRAGDFYRTITLSSQALTVSLSTPTNRPVPRSEFPSAKARIAMVQIRASLWTLK